ncbi:SusC/RagA family TonB-linked outer membrane protein [Reichenbachiella versicolor]|uniref:SusC/RagA family TonB-linked outer membrane protein n=1 Tax=Reichenbachiella versicolor TaxID=1821036 RepID=UPI0013A53BA0|nr:TonB-dependent receptor [Reichenbachiella versicolor]
MKIRFRTEIVRYFWIVMIVALPLSAAWAQDRTVRGVVTDATDGEPIPGVSIINKSTGGGTVTNINGEYSLTVGEDAVLEFSFIGFKKEEIIVGARSVIDIPLKLDIQELSEVVVIGYGQVEKKDATGVVAEVNSDDFNQGVLAGPENLLAGKVAGVQISSSGGQPGASAKIRIRGGTSLNYSNEPLIVVDGVPIESEGHNPGDAQRGRGALNFINPADIESMTVLKDASAAAIYGSRAANGVIIITTKSGQKGKLRATYDGSFTISQFVGDVEFFKPGEYRELVAFKEPDKVNELGDASTDWLDEITQTATGTRHLVTIGKADEKNNYYASASYMKSQGVLKTSETQNINLAARYERKLLRDDLKLKFNVKSGWSDDVYAAEVTNQALIFDPTRAPFNEDGTYFEWNEKLATRNPLAQINQTSEKGTVNRYLFNGQANYVLPFFRDINVNLNASYDFQDGDRIKSLSADRFDANVGDYTGEFYFQEDFERTSKMLEAYVNYNKEFTSLKSKVDLIGGYSYQDFDSRFDFFELDSADLSRNADGSWNEMMFDKNDSSILENRLISFFGRVNYTFNDKYLLTATLRRDGSTRFGEENRWGLFPSLALAWRVIDEDFMAGTDNWLSDLKLRWGYGVTGNQNIPDFKYVSLYEYGQPDASYQFGNEYVPTLRPTGADPDIKWEETVSYNAGVDFGFINGRLYGSVDLYRKNTNDLLNTVAIDAGSNVRDRLIRNVGSVRNEGIEITLNSTVIDNEDFSWSLSLNASANRNEVLALDGSGGNVVYEIGNIAGDVGQTIQVLQVGKPAYSFRTFKHRYDEDGNPHRDNKRYPNQDGTPVDPNSAISLMDMYEDLNGDGKIDDNDLYVGKNPAPKWVAGLTSSMRYKKFDLNFTLRGNFGNYVYNNLASSNNGYSLITDKQVLNNIHKGTLDTDFGQKQLRSDYFIENASFVRLDNISLGYSFDELKYAKIRVYGTVQNVFTITNYSGIDPEISLLGDGINNNGIDNNVYPRAITAILGVNVTF